MNALRVTTYPPTPTGTPDSFTPFTIVVLEEHLAVPLAEAALSNVELGDDLGVFAVTEIIEVPDGAEITEASVVAARRQRERDEIERYQACLYQYDAMGLGMGPNVTIAGTIPAPLDAEDVAYALRRLARHPDYVRQTVIMPSQDEQIVRLASGAVSIEALAP